LVVNSCGESSKDHNIIAEKLGYKL